MLIALATDGGGLFACAQALDTWDARLNCTLRAQTRAACDTVTTMDYRRLTAARASWWLSAFALTLALPLSDGCTSRTTSTSLCDQVCDCETCTDEYLETCKDSREEQADVAMKDGCESEYDAYVECLNSEFRCEDGEAETAQCARELAALTECSPDTSPTPVGCEASLAALEDKAMRCGLDTGTTGTGGNSLCEDTDQAAFIECLTPCYLEAPCSAFEGGAGFDQLSLCLVGCTDFFPPGTGTSTPGTGTSDPPDATTTGG